jgi:hypothetical protein
VSIRRGDAKQSLLRWYPASWRERYGDELVALLEDRSYGGRLTLHARLELAWAGLRERVHST